MISQKLRLSPNVKSIGPFEKEKKVQQKRKRPTDSDNSSDSKNGSTSKKS